MIAARKSRRFHGVNEDAGVVGGLEGLAFGFLVFVVGLLVVVNAWAVVDAKAAASAAAREAARAFVESPSAAGAEAASLDAARAAIEAHGRDSARTELTVSAPDGLARCARVTAEVRHRLPLIRIPLLGQTGDGLTVAARHSELVDAHRSGLPGSASCG